MVDNVFIQCDYCKAKIRMRFQMGYFDIPFDFPCPECGVHIHGLRRITEEHSLKLNNAAVVEFDLNEPHYYADFSVELRFLYKGIIIKHNKTEPTYTKTSLFLCEKRRFLWPGLRKEGNLFKLAGPGGLAFFHLTKKEVSKWPMKK